MGKETEKEGDMGERQDGQLVDVNNQLEKFTCGQDDEEEKEDCRERCCRKQD